MFNTINRLSNGDSEVDREDKKVNSQPNYFTGQSDDAFSYEGGTRMQKKCVHPKTTYVFGFGVESFIKSNFGVGIFLA